jgi:hypothetical protein
MDGYRKGLNGKEAAWASKKYRGHRVLPAGIMDEAKAVVALLTKMFSTPWRNSRTLITAVSFVEPSMYQSRLLAGNSTARDLHN